MHRPRPRQAKQETREQRIARLWSNVEKKLPEYPVTELLERMAQTLVAIDGWPKSQDGIHFCPDKARGQGAGLAGLVYGIRGFADELINRLPDELKREN